MNIFKAFLFTALLLALEVITSLGIYKLTESSINNLDNTEYLTHYIGLTMTIPRIIAYLLIFVVFKIKLNWKNGQSKINGLEIKFIFYLLIITIGLEFFDRPFFDFSKILDSIKNLIAEPYVHTERSNVTLIYRGISALIVAPIFEELVFRKYLFTELLKKYSLKLSIIISSVCFALIHLPSYRNLIPTFIFGIICCLIYRKTKNIIYTIILHFFANLTWFLFSIYGESFFKWIYGLEYDYTYWLLFLLGIFVTILGMKKITTANTV